MNMDDDETLEVLARIAILAGKLPRRRVQWIRAESRDGSSCTLCGDRVDRGEPGWEFDLPGDGDAGPEACALHFRCFAAWNSARERLETHGAPPNKERRVKAAESAVQIT
jgi:hypothetical protein